MKILFLCLSPLKFNVNTPKTEPLGGTESALCYLTKELAKLGAQVTLMRNSDEKDDNITIAGVLHLKISEDIAHLDPDVVVIASAPQAAPGVKAIVPRAKIVLWNHMRPDQPAIVPVFDVENQVALSEIVYVSETQRQAYVDAVKKHSQCCLSDPQHGVIIENAISPFFESMFTGAEEILVTKQCKGAFTSTPYRGLAILASIKEIPIEVYSSMKVYQGDDTSFQTMYDRLEENDCIDFRRSVSQEVLAGCLKHDAFLVYPSIFPECHSIAILEAMAAGLKVITTDVAHKQTNFIDSMDSKTGSLEAYIALLRKNVNFFRSNPEKWADQMWEQVQYVNANYVWSKRALEWAHLLQKVLAYPT